MRLFRKAEQFTVSPKYVLNTLRLLQQVPFSATGLVRRMERILLMFQRDVLINVFRTIMASVRQRRVSFPFQDFRRFTAIVRFLLRLNKILFMVVGNPSVNYSVHSATYPVREAHQVSRFHRIMRIIRRAQVLRAIKPRLLINQHPSRR